MSLLKTHICIKYEIKWRDEFNQKYFFSHGNKAIEQTNKISDKLGGILLVEATTDDIVFILIKIYNVNTELEQLDTLSK